MPYPPLDPNDTTTMITIRLPTKVADRLKREAKQSGKSVSAHLRAILEEQPDKPAANAKARPTP